MADGLAALDHPLRHVLNDEVHARPSDPVSTPSSVTYIANLFNPASGAGGENERLAELLDLVGGGPPAAGAKHLIAQLDGFRLRWERHTEFSRYAFIRPAGAGDAPFARSPLADVPAEWLDGLARELLVAVHLCVVPMPAHPVDIDDISARYFDGNLLVGARIAEGAAIGLTDFRIHADGFSRILVLNESMPDTRAGRYLQRLLENESYRMMALLALPVAQDMLPKLNTSEEELAAINEALVGCVPEEESELLERLTILAARNQGRQAATDFRFAAALAYYELVLQRNEELREVRIPGIQTFTEFTTRRLTPAIKTCNAVARRQQSLVSRMTRSTQLLSTRIDVERQRQNQSILASVNRRLKSQLRLQATVEGISVAAVTYYVVGLIGLFTSGLEKNGVPVNTAIVTAFAVPLVAALVFYAVRRIRRGIDEDEPA